MTRSPTVPNDSTVGKHSRAQSPVHLPTPSLVSRQHSPPAWRCWDLRAAVGTKGSCSAGNNLRFVWNRRLPHFHPNATRRQKPRPVTCSDDQIPASPGPVCLSWTCRGKHLGLESASTIWSGRDPPRNLHGRTAEPVGSEARRSLLDTVRIGDVSDRGP